MCDDDVKDKMHWTVEEMEIILFSYYGGENIY